MKVGGDTPGGRSSKVAVVIVNYYSAEFLRRCLECVSAQSAAPHRVVIINNGDHSEALDFVSGDYPDYELLSPGNIGFAAANNLAIQRLADTDWIVLLNPDAFPGPAWLAEMEMDARRAPNVDVFSSQLIVADTANVIDGEGDGYHFSGWAGRINHNRTEQNALRNARMFSPCAAAAMYRRSALIDVGGFDENYFCYFEDVDLGFRLRLRGYELMHVPGAVALHVGGRSSQELGLSDFAIYHGHRNLVWTFIKNMPGYLFWLFLPAHILMNIFSVLFFCFKGKGLTILRAKVDAMRGLPRVWAQRKQIQEGRKVTPRAILKHISFGFIR